jgi:hypothetical protein
MIAGMIKMSIFSVIGGESQFHAYKQLKFSLIGNTIKLLQYLAEKLQWQTVKA